MLRYDIERGITTHWGGLNAVRIAMGEELDDIAKKASYYNRRGRKTQYILVELFTEWAKLNKFKVSNQKETKVGPKHRLEFVCTNKKVYGVDITNSKTKGSVEQKWKKKKYHEYVDEFWIVVVANKWDEEQYEKWNLDAPHNVLVIDYRKIESFLNGFNANYVPFNIPEDKKMKLKALAECTFYNKEKIKQITSTLGIDHKLKEYVSNYSRGQKLRIALSRVLLIEPELLFLDEPLLGMDPKTSRELIKILLNLNKTILLTSHQMQIVQQLCERIAFLNRGSVIKIDTQENFINILSHFIRLRFNPYLALGD